MDASSSLQRRRSPWLTRRRLIGGATAAILIGLGLTLAIVLRPGNAVTELTGRDVRLTAADGAAIRGLKSAGADDWVIFLHGEGEGLVSWRPLWETLAADDYTLLALELTPHGGSVGAIVAPEIKLDAEAAFELARDEGAATISVIAAGLGGIAALQAGDEQMLTGLVLLSPGPVGGLDVAELRGAGESKLFFMGALDADVLKTAKELRNASIGWAGSISFPTSDQGASLLAGEFASNLRFQVATFLSVLTGRPRTQA